MRSILRRTLAALILCAAPALPLAALERTSIGPEGGPITALVVDASAPATVYAGTAGGGLYKSADRGQTWQEASSGLTEARIAALVLAPGAPGSLYAGTPSGLFRSVDGAGTWASVKLLPAESEDDADIVSLAVDSTDPRTLYAGHVPRSLEDGDLIRSSDGGETWVAVPFPGLPPVALAAAGPLVLAGGGEGLHRSTDGGLTWSPVAGIPGVRSLFLRRQVVFAGTRNGVFRSLDGGASWAPASTGIPSPDVAALAADPADPRVFYAGVSRSGVVRGGVFKSADRGNHWAFEQAGIGRRGVLALAVAPDGPAAALYAGTEADGVFRSTNAAASWSAASRGLRAAGVSSVTFDPAHPGRLYAVSAGLFRSTNGGATWTRLRNDAFGRVAVDSTGAVYALTGGLGLARSRDGGATWKPIDPGLPSEDAFAVDPDHPGRLYAGGHFTVARSTDAGATWSLRDLTCFFPWSLAVVPGSGEVYAGGAPSCGPDGVIGGGVHRSIDAGVTWTDVSANLPLPQFVQTFGADPRAPSHLFAARWPIVGGGAFRSTDHGASWSQLDAPSAIGAFAFPLDAPETVYAGADGVWASPDGGSTWDRLDPLEGRIVTDLVLDPASGALLAATAGGLFHIGFD